MQEALKEEFSM